MKPMLRMWPVSKTPTVQVSIYNDIFSLNGLYHLYIIANDGFVVQHHERFSTPVNGATMKETIAFCLGRMRVDLLIIVFINAATKNAAIELLYEYADFTMRTFCNNLCIVHIIEVYVGAALSVEFLGQSCHHGLVFLFTNGEHSLFFAIGSSRRNEFFTFGVYIRPHLNKCRE